MLKNLLILVLCSAILISWYTKEKPQTQKYPTFTKKFWITPKGKTYIDTLKSYLKKYGVKYPSITIAQVILETGNFNSKLYIEHHNLFGMKVPTIRLKATDKTYKGYLSYDSDEQCILDFALWQSHVMDYSMNKKEEFYLKYLVKRYSTNKEYVKRIKNIIRYYNI